MRLFIAIPVPPDVRRALVSAQEALKGVSVGGRYVPEENFHVTLHFIGESSDFYGAAAACNEAVRGIRPLLLRLTSMGRFVRNGAYTAYMGLSDDEGELRRLHETLISALMEQGFSLSGGRKRLTPHITLARDVQPTEGEHDAFLSLAPMKGAGGAFRANQIILYQSEHKAGRMVYSPLHKARFFDE